MATLQSICSSSFPSASSRKVKATLHSQNYKSSHISVPRLLVNELNQRNGLLNQTATSADTKLNPIFENTKGSNLGDSVSDSNLVQKLYAILEIVADRVEMHNNIKAERDNWNGLLLNSVNGMTLTAAVMAGLSSVSGPGPSILALKISSSLLYMAVTGIVLVMNKIQPSQLAEEQRNASRLFKRLHEEIKTTLALKRPVTFYDVKLAMEKVLALDKAYPLPLIGTMIEKFPQVVEPAVWWPDEESKCHHQNMSSRIERNGWNEKLEEEMKEILGVVKGKDCAEYARLSSTVLKVNKILSFGSSGSVVNTLEHGGQVGKVFEMYRSSAGFFKLMEETIESNLKEGEVGDREYGEIFEVKVALQLGRSLSELRDLASASSLSSRLQSKNLQASFFDLLQVLVLLTT